MATQKNFDQLLIYVNLYQYVKNQAISLIHSGDMIDWKILQSDWLRTFWPKSQKSFFFQIRDLCRNTANNINFHFPNFGGKNNILENPALSGTISYGFLATCLNLEKTNDTIPRNCPYRHEPIIFVEVTLPKKSNLIVGCIYKHPCMDICIFNYHYLNPLLDNLSREANKTIVLLGDFSIHLLNVDTSIIFWMIQPRNSDSPDSSTNQNI